MKKKIIYPSLIAVTFLIFLINNLQSQTPFTTRETAKTIGKKHLEASLFLPLRYGIGKKTELYTKPIVIWKLPHIGIKQNWFSKNQSRNGTSFKDKAWYISTVHSFNYPTMLLKFEEKYRIKNFIKSDSKPIPHIFSFKNELRISTILKSRSSCDYENYLLTLRLGHQFAIESDKSEIKPIKEHIFYRETAIYHDTAVWYVGLDLNTHLTNRINWLIDLDFYSIGYKINDWSIEHKGMIYWLMGRKKRIRAFVGYKLIYGTIHSETSFKFYPLFDIQYLFRSKKHEEGLFEPGIYEPYDDRKRR